VLVVRATVTLQLTKLVPFIADERINAMNRDPDGTSPHPSPMPGDTNNTGPYLPRATNNTYQLLRLGYSRPKLRRNTLCSTPEFSRVYTTHVFHLGLYPAKSAGCRDLKNPSVACVRKQVP
jgi:hypothetical protein